MDLRSRMCCSSFLLQRHRLLPAGAAALQPERERDAELLCDLLVTETLRHWPPCADPELPQTVTDAHGKARVTDVVQQLALHLGH